jgi:hypothetical protein
VLSAITISLRVAITIANPGNLSLSSNHFVVNPVQRVLTSLHNVLFLYLDRPEIRCAKNSEGENVNGESPKFWVPYASHKAHNTVIIAGQVQK